MKSLGVLMFSLLLIVSLPAAPIRNAPTELVQPDGSKFSCFMTGDEYYHRAHDSNGFTIIKNLDSGWYVFAQKQGSDLVPTTFIPGLDDPAARGLTPDLMPDESVLQQRFQNWRGAERDEYGRAPTTGSLDNICIFIRFMGETEFGQSFQIYDDMHNSTSLASMRGFFQEESGNQLTVISSFYPIPTTQVVSWQDSNSRNYYYPQSAGNPIGYPPGPPSDPDLFGFRRLHALLTNAIAGILPMIPPGLTLDVDNDGKVDNFSFICRGNADATSALFWPHFWQMDAYNPVYLINYFGQPLQCVDYNFALQYSDPLFTGYGGGIDTAEISHEFSHTLGFPDLYHYIWDGINPCGYWDLMDYCYQIPQHHLTYLKWKYGGWFTSVNSLPPPGTSCSLNSVASNPFAHFMFQLPTGEQIWIEYRQTSGIYETRLPGSGLIVYRVDQNYSPWGNSGGPPDEVYVYRPSVSISPPDGNINWAQYAWEQAHTALNMFTDPNPFSQSNPGYIAPLNIHSVGSNMGSQIVFEIGNQIPVIWTGLSDNNWFNGANWTTGVVPVATDYVIVAQGTSTCDIPVSPFGLPALCYDLRVEHQLSLQPGSVLIVGNNLDSIGRIFMNGNLMQVGGNLNIANWYMGSWFHSQGNPAAQIQIGGDCLFESGTNIQLTVGQLIFSNIGVSPLVCTFTCDPVNVTLIDWIINKPGGTITFISSPAFPPLFVNGSLNVINNSTLFINSPRQLTVFGNIIVDPTSLLQVPDPLSMITLAGPPGLQAVNIANPNSYVSNLDINNNSNPALGNNISIHGNLTINSGILTANSHSIFLQGNWINNVGLGGFQQGTSRVIFCAPVTDQSIAVGGASGSLVENFYTLELNKTTGSLNMNSPGQIVQCDFYDWSSGMLKVTDGVFKALSLVDGSIMGSITCNAPGMIDLYDTSGNGDLAGSLIIQGGTVRVNCPTAGAGSFATWGTQPGSLSMGSGQLLYPNCGIHIISPNFSSNISGGQIHVQGDFEISGPGFNPTGGLVSINSPTAPVFIGCLGGTWFHDLDLQSQTDTSYPARINGNLNVFNTFNVLHDLTLNGTLNLSGTMSMQNPLIAQVNGVANIQAGSVLNLRDATMILSGSYPINLDATITINNGCLDASNHSLQINPAGLISFGVPGPGLNGKLSCAVLNANSSGTFCPSAGTLDLNSNSSSSLYAMSIAAGNWVNNLDLNLASSVQLMTDLTIRGNLHLIQGEFIMDSSGRTLDVWGNWIDDTGGSGFICANSIVNFNGTGHSTIQNSSGTEEYYQLNSSPGNGLSLNGNVSVQNSLNIMNSPLLVNGRELVVTGNTTISSGGTLNLDPGSVMMIGNGNSIQIQSSGIFKSHGVAGNRAILRAYSGGNWHLNAQTGSTISVQYSQFQNLDTNGINIMNGANVDLTADFDNCIFSDGASGVTYLTVDNNQTLSISDIVFSNPVSGGSNIAKSVNEGIVNVLSSVGNFAGPLYENDTYTRINWTGYDPNLVVQSFTVTDSNPYVGDQVSYSVVIRNDSPNPVQSGFNIHLFKNRLSAPGWTETGDYQHTCPILAPNETHSFTFSGVYSMEDQGWISWLLVDPELAIHETNEIDNLDSETLTWLALPAIMSLTINGAGQLSWTYPIWATRYTIYDSSYPYGPFTFLGSTTNSYYDISLAHGMRFYEVKAERDAPAK